jgi:hypothetical protein
VDGQGESRAESGSPPSLPPGHPDLTGAAPTVGRPQGQARDLPPGHPDLTGRAAPGEPGQIGQAAPAAGNLPAGHPAIPAENAPAAGGATANGAAGATWQMPASWQPRTQGTGFSAAAFTVPGGDASAAVTVTPMQGMAGGVLANVNRWREQVGLNRVEKLEDQPATRLDVSGLPANLYDFVAPQGSDTRTHLLVAMLARPSQGDVWFFKMTGPDSVVSKAKDDFVKFVQSVKFAAEQ